MVEETLHHRGTTLVGRLILAPDGEATRWQRDPFYRVSVVFGGEALLIEFRDGRASVRVPVEPGQVDWDEPGARFHRAVNLASVRYEVVTVFFLAHPDDVLVVAGSRLLHRTLSPKNVSYGRKVIWD